MNLFKEKLKKKEITIGSWISFAHTGIAEIMAKAGFEWLVIDMEHSAITLTEAQQLIQVIDLAGKIPLVRVGENDETLIKRIMDAGARGIIVPMVNSKEEAMCAVSSIKYPPKGTRGVGLARAQGYGADFKQYFKTINDESIVIVQIEHKKGVENIDDIVDVEGIDGAMIGPYDLSASYNVPGELEHPIVVNAQEKVKKSAIKKGVALGTHVVWPIIDKVEGKIKDGFNFIAYSTDMIMLQYHFSSAVKEIKKFL